MRNKRGGIDLTFSEVIFIVLNLAFFAILATFVVSASNGSLFYEQAYSKQIVLILDSSNSGMEIEMDFSEGVRIMEKTGFSLSKVLLIHKEDNFVKISFRESKGYSVSYFSEVDFEYELKGDKLIFKIL